MTLELVNRSDLRIPRRFLSWWVKEFAKWLSRKKTASLKNKELYLVFLGRKEAKALNKKYREKDYATDVLSFEGVDENSLGELIFCAEVLRRQARDHGLSLQLELGYLVIHGTLHLLGYEHEDDPREAEKMYALQDAAFDFLTRKWQSRE